jgi:ParB family chromosome partitioning protein
MQMPIDQIRIKKRARKDLGSLQPLMDSLREQGLLNPIVINTKNELIAGQRRLESAKRLGWQSVAVTVVDRLSEADKLAMEIDENMYRLDLTPEELAEARSRLEKLRNPGLLRKILLALVRFFRWLFEKP